MTKLDQIKKQGRINLLIGFAVLAILLVALLALATVKTYWDYTACAVSVLLIYLLWYVRSGSRLLRGLLCPCCNRPLLYKINDSNEAVLIAFFVPKDLASCLSCGADLNK